MSIDERLEALTQSVELLSSMHQDLEKRQDVAVEIMREALPPIAKAISQLATIVQDHDARLKRLEGN